MHEVRKRFWLEAALAAAGLALALLTLAWPEWIEEIFGIEPDGGNGAAEWGIVIALIGAAVALGLTARREWRRTAAA
jgi:hypothetical protein